MARPVTIFTGQWADLGLEEMCSLAKQMGYQGLEIATWGQLNVRKAAEDTDYVAQVKNTLEKYGLGCWAIGAHLPGQCVGDLWDSRLDGFAPAELAGKPEEIRAWGIEEMKYAAKAAKAMGVKVCLLYTSWIYQRKQRLIQRRRFRIWKRIFSFYIKFRRVLGV